MMKTVNRIQMMKGDRFLIQDNGAEVQDDSRHNESRFCEFTDEDLDAFDAGNSLIGRLRWFINESPLSFYEIASRIGTRGAILSMWIAGTSRPQTTELIAIDRFLKSAVLLSTESTHY